MVKKALCLMLVTTIILVSSGCQYLAFPIMVALSDDRASREEILTFVQEHQDLILSCIEQKDYSSLDSYSIIKEIYEYGDHIDFYCGGSGMGSQTNYWGFYYSANDYLKAVWCAQPGELIPRDNGYYCAEEGGDNSYYVEYICDHFYYYTAHF